MVIVEHKVNDLKWLMGNFKEDQGNGIFGELNSMSYTGGPRFE